MSVSIRPMSAEDHERVLELWRSSEGIGLSATDTVEGLAAFLDRNPNLSFVAEDGRELVGAVLCGHDGRRGYIYHLAVDREHRDKGIGAALVERCRTALKRAGIDKCHIFVFRDNPEALAFWRRVGWEDRDDLAVLSRYTDEDG
jgi:ribosomal protein S18 acetylase RimI-like enzyme